MKNIVELPKQGYAVFVGDTHGDIQASRLVVRQYAKKGHCIVFLGDYVDRGEKSKENIDFLLSSQKQYPGIILLAGNHEMSMIEPVSPSNFWDSLDKNEAEEYSEIFKSFPLAASGNGFLAVHAGLPDLPILEDWDKIKPGDDNWERVLWADFRDKEGECLGSLCGRIKLGRDYFYRVMDSLKKNVLVRSHDPYAPERMFNNRCLTLFTSALYGRLRQIALVDLSKHIMSIDDFELITF